MRQPARSAAPVGDRRTPALDAWHAELAAGKRTPTTFDALWRAAVAERSAVEFESLGLPSIASRYRDEARRIIAQAAKSTAHSPEPAGSRG